ncbi:hypothetical protein BKK79_37145 (plasmid) [Cupriavidus sp. USMAA2-4]|uniref:hypothetical protein n=1 Tax=Cupriavidus sp. USMAA2-4 TaxID=876364 RepID=UPI0008A6B4F2|nr:hypothetical protein [Cupriavidus sp. USMAA2-4]AOY97566.1 hypothetical protein BKK79_37145 [Cupriavidus sp. USMAA2-4]
MTNIAPIDPTTKVPRKRAAPSKSSPKKGKPPAQAATLPGQTDPRRAAALALCSKEDSQLNQGERAIVEGIRAVAAALMAHPALVEHGHLVGASIAGGSALPMLIQRFVAPTLAPSDGSGPTVDRRWLVIERLQAAVEPQRDFFWSDDAWPEKKRRGAQKASESATDVRQGSLFGGEQ